MRINLQTAREAEPLQLRVFWQYDLGNDTTCCFIVDGTVGKDIKNEDGSYNYYVKSCTTKSKRDRHIKALARKYSLDRAIKLMFPDNANLRAECWNQAFASGVHFAPRDRVKENAIKYAQSKLVEKIEQKYRLETFV